MNRSVMNDEFIGEYCSAEFTDNNWIRPKLFLSILKGEGIGPKLPLRSI